MTSSPIFLNISIFRNDQMGPLPMECHIYTSTFSCTTVFKEVSLLPRIPVHTLVLFVISFKVCASFIEIIIDYSIFEFLTFIIEFLTLWRLLNFWIYDVVVRWCLGAGKWKAPDVEWCLGTGKWKAPWCRQQTVGAGGAFLVVRRSFLQSDLIIVHNKGPQHFNLILNEYINNVAHKYKSIYF